MGNGKKTGLLWRRLGVVSLIATFSQVASAELPKYEILDFWLGYEFAKITAINNAGYVTGGQADAEQWFLYFDRARREGECLGKWNYGLDVNNVGQVAGIRNYSADGSFVAFKFSGGVCADIGTLGGRNSFGISINNSGQVTGWAELPGDEPDSTGDRRAFLYSDGNLTDLGTLGGSYSSGLLVDEDGQVIGLSSTANGDLHLFRYTGETMNDLGRLGADDGSVVVTAVNAAGQAVGYTIDAQDNSRAFLFSEGLMIDLGALGGSRSRAYDVNSTGQVTGWAETGDGYTHAFLYNNGLMTDLGSLGQNSLGTDINDASQITGVTDTPSGGRTFFIFGDGQMQDVWSLGLSRFSGDGYASDYNGAKMNDVGQVTFLMRDVPYAVPPYAEVGFLMTPISLLFAQLHDGVIGIGPGNSLVDTVMVAQAYYDADDGPATCGSLAGFINKVEAQVGKKIPQDQAGEFIEDAIAIRDAIGCQ